MVNGLHIQKQDVKVDQSTVAIRNSKLIEKLIQFPQDTTQDLATLLEIPNVRRSDITVDSDGFLILNGSEYVNAFQNKIEALKRQAILTDGPPPDEMQWVGFICGGGCHS
jgi:hypothetical protein